MGVQGAVDGPSLLNANLAAVASARHGSLLGLAAESPHEADQFAGDDDAHDVHGTFGTNRVGANAADAHLDRVLLGQAVRRVELDRLVDHLPRQLLRVLGREVAENELIDLPIAAAALQRFGDTGLLRSVAVAASRRGTGLGRALAEERMGWAAELGLPVVATHPVQFISADDFKAHEARVCIAEGYVLNDKRRAKAYTAQQYFKTQAEMAELFADLPEALQNSVEIARRCNLSLVLGKPSLPDFPTPNGQGLDDYLREQSELGLRLNKSDNIQHLEVKGFEHFS